MVQKYEKKSQKFSFYLSQEKDTGAVTRENIRSGRLRTRAAVEAKQQQQAGTDNQPNTKKTAKNSSNAPETSQASTGGRNNKKKKGGRK